MHLSSCLHKYLKDMAYLVYFHGDNLQQQKICCENIQCKPAFELLSNNSRQTRKVPQYLFLMLNDINAVKSAVNKYISRDRKICVCENFLSWVCRSELVQELLKWKQIFLHIWAHIKSFLKTSVYTSDNITVGNHYITFGRHIVTSNSRKV